MASVGKDSKGYRVRFVMPDGTNKTIRLSGFNKSKSEDIARHIEELIAAKASGSAIDRATSNWLAKIGQNVHDKLSNAGLIETRASSLLGEFIAEYLNDGKTIDGKAAAANTLKKWKQTQQVLDEFFCNRNLRDISHDDAAKFRRWMDGKAFAENYKRTHIGVTKMFFNAAKRRKLIDENPFEFQKASLVLDRSRDFFLTRANAMKIIDACPDSQWRLIVALWRFAGLRKMEIFQLRWEHVLWDKGRMLVTIPKTRHHEGKETRFVPIGDILPWLEQSFNEAPEGSQRLITRFTESNVNLAKPFEKIITVAGLTIWPKLIQNLRASCETDWLDAGNPAHVVAKWIGHSVKVQNDNYAQVDDHHFDQFNTKSKLVQSAEKLEKLATTADDSSTVAIQVASETRETTQTTEQAKRKNPVKTNVLRGSADECAYLHPDRLPEAGVEPAHGITHTGF